MQTQVAVAKGSKGSLERGQPGGLSWERLAKEAHYRPNLLAELCGVSMRTLQRYFRSHFNQTVSEWLRDLRLTEAFTSLKNCDSIKNVAFDLGYKQPSHFTRDFKKKFGVPPKSLVVYPRYARFPAAPPKTETPQ